MVSYLEVEAAADRISSYVHMTPLLHSTYLSRLCGTRCYLKLENWQKTGSFKARGAFNALLSHRGSRGFVTASSGNHGQAVAYAAKTLGIPAVVVVPENGQRVKAAAIIDYGAEILRYGTKSEERRQLAKQIAADRNFTFVHSFDDPYIIAGQGTCAWEVIDQLPEVEAILVPVGGGGLAAGTALLKEKKPKVSVIGVEPEQSAGMHLSLSKGAVTPFPVGDTMADGLKAAQPGELTFSLAQRYLDAVITVSEAEILTAMKLLLERVKVLAEPSGAVSLAGLIKMRERFQNKEVVCVVSGGNVDLVRLGHLLTQI